MAWCSVKKKHRDNFTFVFYWLICTSEAAVPNKSLKVYSSFGVHISPKLILYDFAYKISVNARFIMDIDVLLRG
jgi:hypothetical protein